MVQPGDHLIAMTKKGQIMRTIIDGISLIGRNTMGVIIMDMSKGDRLASVDIIPNSSVGEFTIDDEPEEDGSDPITETPSEEDGSDPITETPSE